MKNIIKIFGLLAVIAVIPASWAATSRAGVVNKASPRLPSIAGHIITSSTNVNGTVINNNNNSAYYNNTECIEKYTDCIKADDVCGSDFEECTTNVLFHGQMSKCLSVLYQCQSSGITALFGTSAINALSTVLSTSTVDGTTEVTRYTYPTDGSVLGQLIIGAAISNQLNTEQCVKSYTRCLQREDNCGADFELCTTKKEFKKQALLCDSTLARCQSEGKKQLFGSVANADSLNPATESRLGQLIEQGQQLAAMNAVKTCQKVTDNCLVSACTRNPLRCVEGTSMATIGAADFVTGNNELTGDTSSTQTINSSTGYAGYNDNYLESLTGSDIRKMLKAQCLETIGTNRYCHMTYREKAPSNKDLMDIDLQEDVFALAYAARKDAVNTKIQEALKKFDTKAKDRCYETIKSCAMSSCGGGIGSVCYSEAGRGGRSVHVNDTNTYGEIESGCSAIVNADANCIYAATSADGYQYAYTDATTFSTIFPQYDNGDEIDIIGAVGKLNALLSTSYNDAAIENMKKQCQTVALSCVKSMCGKDYVNCYRNRTDIVAGSYNTGSGALDRSMNKMGGILDYNIVMGLCMDTVKSSSVCEEHLKVATASWRRNQTWDAESWGSNTSVRDAWLGANTTTVDTNARSNEVVIACMATNTTAGGMDCSGTMEPINGACLGVMDEDGCIYDTPVTQGMSEYALTNGATTLFQTLLVDVEKNAQALYNAKLTKEQNVCLSNNNGGVMGKGENGSTFMWVKLKTSKLPKHYASKGLTANQFTASNDLYGSFCRVKVTIQSDDKYIQDQLGANATAYFAVGDAFTCGSWISQSTLDNISTAVGEKARKDAGEGSDKDKWRKVWATAVPAIAGTIGGYALTDSLQKDGSALGGLLGNSYSKNEDKAKAAESCLDEVKSARVKYWEIPTETNQATAATKFRQALQHANNAKSYARKAGASSAELNAMNFDMATYTEWGFEDVTLGGYDAQTVAATYNVYKQDDVIKIQTVMRDLAQVSKMCGTKCKGKLDEAQRLLAKSNPEQSDATAVISSIQAAKEECNKNTSGTNIHSCDSVSTDNLALTIETVTNNIDIKGQEGKSYRIVTQNGTRIQDGGKDSPYAKLPTHLNKLEELCSKAASDADDNKTGRVVKNVLGGAIGGVGLGILGNQIAQSVQETRYENAEKQAINEWMEQVGRHMTCYVGTEEVGDYGTVVQLEIN